MLTSCGIRRILNVMGSFMLKQSHLEVDALIESLQNAALNVLRVVELSELRLPIKGTVPQLYLTISQGRRAEIDAPSTNHNYLAEI